jgi:hypothetical protein
MEKFEQDLKTHSPNLWRMGERGVLFLAFLLELMRFINHVQHG